MTVPLGPEVTEIVRLFLAVNDITLSETNIGALSAVAGDVWGHGDKMHAVRKLHKQIFWPNPDAGLCRPGSLLADSGKVRDYPSYNAISRLMVEYFTQVYIRALQGEWSIAGHGPEHIAWYVGAVGRCIHPFWSGNRIVFWLIENQIRILHGLEPTTQLSPKSMFDGFREQSFKPAVTAIYSEEAGA